MNTSLPCATLYYDGRCPLCRSEMRLLRRLKRDELHLQDIHRLPLSDQQEAEGLLRRLQLQRGDGSWAKGVDAVVEAWGYTPLGALVRPLRWSITKPWVDRTYNRWADQRYCKRYSACAVTSDE